MLRHVCCKHEYRYQNLGQLLLPAVCSQVATFMYIATSCVNWHFRFLTTISPLRSRLLHLPGYSMSRPFHFKSSFKLFPAGGGSSNAQQSRWVQYILMNCYGSMTECMHTCTCQDVDTCVQHCTRIMCTNLERVYHIVTSTTRCDHSHSN